MRKIHFYGLKIDFLILKDKCYRVTLNTLYKLNI